MKLLKTPTILISLGAILGIVAADQIDLVCSGVRSGFPGLF